MEKSSALNMPILFCQHVLASSPHPSLSTTADLRECLLNAKVDQLSFTRSEEADTKAYLMTFAMNASM